MMKKSLTLPGLLSVLLSSILLMAGLMFTACPTDGGDGGGTPSKVPSTEGKLTIDGLPSGGTWAVYIFSTGTDISTYSAITTAYANGSYQAVGVFSEGNLTLYTWTGGSQGGVFLGSGNYPVLLLNSGGSITDTGNPMYSRATVSFTNGAGTISYSGFSAVVYGGNDPANPNGDDPVVPGAGGKLTISGLPGGSTRAVYVFSSGTDISTYSAITTAYMNGSYQAVGASLASDGAFTLYTWSGGSQGGGFSGNGSYPVLLLNSTGSISDTANPMYSRATVSFSNGTGTASYGSFSAVVYGSDDPSGAGGKLTITGLPTGGTRAVYVFSSGTDISTYTAISSAYMNGSYQAVGATPGSDGVFTLYTWSGGSQGGGFSGNGSYPVLLLNSGGSITDTANPMYSRATVTFTDGTGTVSYSGFSAVVYEGTPTVVNDFSLDAKVTAPVKGAAPDTTAINGTQYTGSITWQTSGGTAHTGAFAANTVYKAVVTLTAKTGYTFTGVGNNRFKYTGVTTITNAANSGTVTITFPATERDPNIEIPPPTGNPSIKLYLDSNTTPLAHGGTTTITAGTGIYTVDIDSSYYSIVWHLNGTELTQYAERTSLLLRQTAGTYLVTVVATADNGVKQSGVHTFVVQ